MANKKKRSRRWSLNELKDLHSTIHYAEKVGDSIDLAKEALADKYQVTVNAINLRYKRYLAGKSVPDRNKATVKEPTLGKGKRRPYKKRVSKAEVFTDRSVVLPIKDLNIDLKKGTLTIIY